MRFNVEKILNYSLVYLLVALSGVPFFYRSKMALLIPAMLLSLLVFIYYRRKLDKFLAYFSAFYALILAGQTLKFYYLPLDTYFGLYIRILFAYFVIASLKEKFTDYFIDVIYVSSLISFLFYIPSYLPGFETVMKTNVAPHLISPFVNVAGGYDYPSNVILYTFNSRGGGALLRNSGPFWEPGAFAGFLVIAIIFNLISKGTLWDKKGKVLILTLVSTFSTTGLMALMLFITFYVLTHRSSYLKILVMPLIIFGSIFFFASSSILLKKIETDMDIENAAYNTRFKSASIDFNDFLENPLLGLGRNEYTRFKGNVGEGAFNHRNNGVTNFLASYGIVMFLVYFGLIYFSFLRMCNHHDFNKLFAFFSVLLILIIGFSEDYFNFPFFYGLTFLHIVYGNNEKTALT